MAWCRGQCRRDVRVGDLPMEAEDRKITKKRSLYQAVRVHLKHAGFEGSTEAVRKLGRNPRRTMSTLP